MSRIDLIKMSSVPLWIRRISTTIEMVDAEPRVPSNTALHDDGHAVAQIIGERGRARPGAKSFGDDEDLREYLVRKTQLTDAVVNDVLAIKEKWERLKYESVLFGETHESEFGSIENFSPGRKAETRLLAFLSKEEQRALGAFNAYEVFLKIREFYLKAGGD